MCDDEKSVIEYQDIDPSSIRILFIDDQQTIREIFCEILSKKGYVIELSTDSEEGLRKFSENSYDIVYTDLSMPGKSGLEVASEIKGKSPETVIILITGWVLEQEMNSQQLKENGVDLVITKPFRVNEIHESIEKAMKIKQNYKC